MTQSNPDTFPRHDRRAADTAAWLTLSLMPGMTSRLFNALLDTFHTPGAILDGGRDPLMAAGAPAGLAERIALAGKGKAPDAVKRGVAGSLAWCEHPLQHIVTRTSPDYPPLLAAIPDPPPLLYIRGNSDCLHLPQLAMVGSRRPSADGRRHARRFARNFAQGGVGVCSGLALGIDAESHRGALAGGGFTVAVLGTGIDCVYPKANADLFGRIVEQGALVSEFNPGTGPHAGNFPKRNRLISGLSVGVLVVEAGVKSGSMITARFALEQGRDVFAIPGSIDNPMARGCHQLIASGARLVNSPAEVVTECAAMLGCFHGGEPGEADPEPGPPAQPLSADQRRLKAAIGHDPVALDTLVNDTGLDTARVCALLAELEILDVVRRTPAGYTLAVPD